VKVKPYVTGVLVAGVLVSTAAAAPPAEKGKPPTTGPGCKPRIAVILKGTLAAPGSSSISVKVTSSNRWGRAYVGGSDKSIAVNASTKVRRQGEKTLADLKAGDRVLVQARACKADLANSATPALTATKVVAHPPGAAQDD
jgi:hypothetical protein